MSRKRLLAILAAVAGSLLVLLVLYVRTGRLSFGAIEVWGFATATMLLAAFHFTKPPRDGGRE
ncbi:hypothetical protein [Pontivivens insulae]|uniref:Uncharacterized protein n=1 Tax=Pontivivens insulae TaxID=1639689 RepID=A0A2R8A8N8_9RHOB|nr:hypothetical protein [Pontivivens insulae]RED18695.1 hypothetical protein DFR53_0894 [Pontivivens insulae]SPF28593.1 hypothetical protein POI8812_00895 [Pontivivens insulae]